MKRVSWVNSLANPVFHGPYNLDFDSLKQVAHDHGSTGYVESRPTDTTESGYILNPGYSQYQFAIAEYDMGNGYTFTHSLATYMPPIANNPNRSVQENLAGARLINVIDINLPYHVPHALIVPRVYMDATTRFINPLGSAYSRHVAKRVQLEGDFSEFVDVYVPPDEDISAFQYLAPNVMELLLQRQMMDVTVEFVDMHVYLYFMPRKATFTPLGQPAVSVEEYSRAQAMGSIVAQSMVRAARPSKQSFAPLRRLPHPSLLRTLVFKQPIMIAFLLTFAAPFLGVFGFTVLPVLLLSVLAGFLSMPIAIALHMYRMRVHKKRLIRYRQRYGAGVKQQAAFSPPEPPVV